MKEFWKCLMMILIYVGLDCNCIEVTLDIKRKYQEGQGMASLSIKIYFLRNTENTLRKLYLDELNILIDAVFLSYKKQAS